MSAPGNFTVELRPSGTRFEASPDETVLEAGLRQHLVLPYGCRDGACGTCKAKVLKGSVEQQTHSQTALSAEEQALGYALLCRSRARSDLAVQARALERAADIPVRKLPARIASIERPAPDVAVLRLQLPANEKLAFLAGQYVELILRDGTRRQYSLAVAPENAERLELHVRHLPGGRFTDALFGVTEPAVKERDVLRFEGPLGTFFLREDNDRPIVFVASGTGFAPIKAIIEHCLAARITRPMALYWGGRRPADLYMDELCRQWQREIPGFSYVPVVSDALAEDQWSGRTGFVHRAVMADLPDLSGHQVYACGAPVVVNSARRDFVASCALPETEFFADSFTSSADLAADADD